MRPLGGALAKKECQFAHIDMKNVRRTASKYSYLGVIFV
jgi:hypothetical protein